MQEKVAIIYQTLTPPGRNGSIKPMKPGGYSDSGTDIAYSLQQKGISIITPVKQPQIEQDLDWVFPDTQEGIQTALDRGATVIWLNTILYRGHPIEEFIDNGLSVIGQIPENVDKYDDKWVTNQLLQANGLPIPKSTLIAKENSNTHIVNLPFPLVTKPILGRGSQGVKLVSNKQELAIILDDMFTSGLYGDAIYLEEFLPGEEVTITVMPPGNYTTKGESVQKKQYWSLPAVRRFNHENGVAPYNGKVAVVNNSAVLDDVILASPKIKSLSGLCEEAAQLVNAMAPIRIDCRADADGNYFLFDLNMKPNMTGASRPHRGDQDSLTALAARKIGWDFNDLILNMYQQHWKK